jgi:ssDNA-binding Zn-finger/Zn-ribbon topoisomerase 1
LKAVFPGEFHLNSEPSERIYYSDSVEMKMNELLLLRDDIEQTFCECESSDSYIVDFHTKQRIAGLRRRSTTIWIVYEFTDSDHVVLNNVYTHRMQLADILKDPLAGTEEQNGLHCGRCGKALKMVKVRFHYLGHDFFHSLSGCPDCGLVFVPEALSSGKMSDVEIMLEDK